MTEGPYFVEGQLERSDIRSNSADETVQEGVKLQLTFRVSLATADGCVPLAGAQIDVWHCNALGVYSAVTSGGNNAGDQDFLRGYQFTDEAGIARFTTIYPGWYRGRTAHIHFMVRGYTSWGEYYYFASQLFFDDAVSAHVFTQAPYASRGQPDTNNGTDILFRNGGKQMLLNLTQQDRGYSAVFDIAVDVADTP